jgi:glycosyltransferase involved in cell wall biosynthesis
MHVVIFSEHFHKDPSGPRLSVLEISRALVRRGLRVTILNLGPETKDEPVEGVGVALHRRYNWKLIPTRYGRHRFCARQLHKLHKADAIDCVVAMGIWSGDGALLFRERTGVPFVLNPRSRVSGKEGTQERADRVARACDAFVGISETEVAGWCEDLNLTRDERFFAVHNGFNPAVLQGDEEPLPGVPTDQPIILCMGMLRRAKGQHRIMQALEMMEGEPWFAIFAGEGRPHEVSWVRERHAEMHLKHRMLLPGLVTGARWRWLYRHADIFALTPVYPEAFGNAFLEAQAAGLPVITSDGGGNVEVVSKESAIIVSRGDDMDAQIVAALRKLLNDPALRKRMGEAGKARAATFTWDNTAAGYHKAVEYAMARVAGG